MQFGMAQYVQQAQYFHNVVLRRTSLGRLGEMVQLVLSCGTAFSFRETHAQKNQGAKAQMNQTIRKKPDTKVSMQLFEHEARRFKFRIAESWLHAWVVQKTRVLVMVIL